MAVSSSVALRCAPRRRVTAGQVEALVGRLRADGSVPLFVFDAGYDPIALSVDLAGVRAEVLVRIRSDRVFSTDPATPTPGTRGRPRRHGERFACADPASWPAPATALTTTDTRYGRVEVQAWHGLHPTLQGRGRWAGDDGPAIVRGTVISVAVEHLPKPTARALKTLWLWWSGPGTSDPDVCWRAYIHRFDIEHMLRFVKHTLGWTTPRVRLPETGRPLDLARRRGVHPASPRPGARRRLPIALGAQGQPPRTS